jgi:hypothetical protein
LPEHVGTEDELLVEKRKHKLKQEHQKVREKTERKTNHKQK